MRKLFFTGRKLYILTIALEAVFANRFRSMLTALGIIFGVAAVIAMLAIGNGARQEILEQMKLVGVNNIIIMPKVESKMEEAAKNTAGVKDATVNFMMLKMIVEFEDGQDPKAVMKDVLKNCKKVEDDCEIYL